MPCRRPLLPSAMPLVLLLTALTAPGCQDGQSFRSLSLAGPSGTGPDQAAAFAAGREVLSQYFPIDSADPATGQIISRAGLPAGRPGHPHSATPARELAVLRLRPEPQGIIADIRVAIQRSDAVGVRLPAVLCGQLPKFINIHINIEKNKKNCILK